MDSKASALKSLEGQWFSEVSSLWPGQAFSIEAEEVLFTAKSEFQVSENEMRKVK